MSVYRRGLAEIGVNHTPLSVRRKADDHKTKDVNEENLKQKSMVRFNSTESTALSTESELDYPSRVDDVQAYITRSPYQSTKTPILKESTLSEWKKDEERIEGFGQTDEDGRFNFEEFAKPFSVLQESTLTPYYCHNEPIERFGRSDGDDGRFHFDELAEVFPILKERDYGFNKVDDFDVSFSDLPQAEIDAMDRILESLAMKENNHENNVY